MAISPTYPGVYIQELPSPVHAIAGVATSIAAFVGYTARGIDNRAEQIFSFSDFERLFGGLASDSEVSYAVQQFFGNGGTQAYVVRAPRHGASGVISASAMGAPLYCATNPTCSLTGGVVPCATASADSHAQLLLAAASAGLSFSVAAQDVPRQLQPPANVEQLLLQVHAKGDQVTSARVTLRNSLGR